MLFRRSLRSWSPRSARFFLIVTPETSASWVLSDLTTDDTDTDDLVSLENGIDALFSDAFCSNIRAAEETNLRLGAWSSSVGTLGSAKARSLADTRVGLGASLAELSDSSGCLGLVATGGGTLDCWASAEGEAAGAMVTRCA